ncbi:hypothetical protein [Nocardia sp. NPDC047654]|uniref:hypothetical protein n=1 Tax=Nocardia sp. NPDC047654 TaxID=3364314 RepID=UPI0037168D49
MLFDPEPVLAMARAIEPAADATWGHASRISAAGFEATHAGQDYSEQGRKLAAGVDGIVTMLQSWSAASGETADALRQSVTANVAVDQGNRSRTDALTAESGLA